MTETRAVPAKMPDATSPQGTPAYCRVLGVARPTADSDIRVEVALPPKDAWNHRYLQVGNGGFAGDLPDDDILEGLAAGYAVAGTDDGHMSKSGEDASWAAGHPEKVIDFGYRALKETTEAARVVVRAYTGQAPAHSYFQGSRTAGARR